MRVFFGSALWTEGQPAVNTGNHAGNSGFGRGAQAVTIPREVHPLTTGEAAIKLGCGAAGVRQRTACFALRNPGPAGSGPIFRAARGHAKQ